MKEIPLLLIGLLCVSCATNQTSQKYRGVGSRDSKGHPVGSWTLYHWNSSLFAKGLFKNENPQGKWEFYDSTHTHVADLNFKNGALDGRYRFYYSGFSGAESKGKIKTIGSANAGRLQGAFTRYGPDGNVVVDYLSDGTQINVVKIGTKEEAAFQFHADASYLDTFFRALASATE